MRRPLLHTRRAERGAIIPLTAMLLTVLFIGVAFAIDLGRLTSERRSMQADADMIALDLARLADGRTETQILSSVDYATTIARSAAANNIAVSDLRVDYGTYDATTDTWDPVGDPPNAVEVQATGKVDYHFARVIGSNSGTTSRTAIAAVDGLASLTLGSKTASLDTGDISILNFVLEQFFGPDFDFQTELDAAGYAGAADFDFDLEDFDVNGSGATPEQILDQEVTAQDYGLLMADVLRNDGRTVEADLLESLALQADNTFLFQIGDVIDADVGGPPAVADADVNALDQLFAGLEVANGQNTAATCAGVPGFAVPGLLNTSLDICTRLIEAGKTVIGRVGDSRTSPPAFRTSQVTIDTTSGTDVGLNVLGLVDISGRLALPVSLTGGGAEGQLLAIDCNQATGLQSTDTRVFPRPIAGTLGGGKRTDGGAPILTLQVRGGLFGSVLASIDVYLGKTITPTTTTSTDILGQLVDQTEEAAGSGLALNLGPITPNDLNAYITSGALPLGVDLSAITAAVAPVVNRLLAGLASPDITALLNSLGLGISESDLRLNDVACDAPLLRR